MKEPFINRMFPNNYFQPHEKDYLPKTQNITIYSFYEKYRNDDQTQYCEYCDTELGHDNGEYENCDCEDAKDSQSAFPKLSKITLQSILDMLPKGVKPSDVKISMGLDTGDMGIYGQEIKFYYEKIFGAGDPEGYMADLKQYNENYQSYLIEKQKYDEWKRQEEIKELEDKLVKLKK